MKLSMRIPSMGRELGFEGVARWAAENGFDALDVGPITPEMKRILDQYGLGIGSVDARAVSGVLSPDPERRAAAAREMKEGISQAAELGAKVIFICLVPEDRQAGRAKNFAIWQEAFPEIVSHAEREGVSLAMEPWPGGAPHYPTLGCTPEMWRAMFAHIPSQSLGLCYDPSHMIRLGIDYKRVLAEFGDRIRHVHAKDCEVIAETLYETGILGPSFGTSLGFSEGWWRYCIPGTGQADWAYINAHLEIRGYSGYFSVELEDHRFRGVEGEKRGLLLAKRHLESIG
ncbi:MAG TPA: sugar phosphate isomerase/epimerase [Limnochordia bacterium]